MEDTMFTLAQIAAFTKQQCRDAAKWDAFLSQEEKDAITARMDVLTAPPAPTPFPKQDALTEAFEQWKAWDGVIKDLTAEARAGNHTYVVDPAEGPVTPKKQRKPRDPNAPKRERKQSDKERKPADGRPVVNGVEYRSFKAAADGLGLTAGMAQEDIDAKSWRRHLGVAAEVIFDTEKMHDGFKQRMIDGAAGKLPNWTGMDYTLIHPVTGEKWALPTAAK
jgi:hypothetical protein